MKNYTLQEYKKNRNVRLVLQHYQQHDPEHWIVKKAEIVMDELLIFEVPETCYDTPEYLMFDSYMEEVRDFEENIVGILRIAEPGENIKISINELSRLIVDMQVGEVIYFSSTENSGSWGITKVKLIDGNCIIMDCREGGDRDHKFYDLTHDIDVTEIASFLEFALKSRATEFIYWEVS